MAGFFRFLWRLNAVLAFIAALAAIVFLVLFSKERIKQPLMNYVVPPPVVTVKAKPAYSYVLEQDMVAGASSDNVPFNLYRLVRWGKIKGQPMTPEAAATVNILVVDKKTSANSWMFPGFERSILSQEPLLTGRWYYREPDVDDDVPLRLLVLRVVDADSNADGYLGAGDRQSLYLYRFDGKPPEKLMSADQIWSADQLGKVFQVTARDGGEAYFATYALPDFKLVSKTAIRDMPK
jgi:hypothetical protein